MTAYDKRIWVCSKCGKYADSRDDVGDVSCYINSIEANKEDIELGEDGRVVAVRVSQRQKVEEV